MDAHSQVGAEVKSDSLSRDELIARLHALDAQRREAWGRRDMDEYMKLVDAQKAVCDALTAIDATRA